jgi:hypothetical protein
MPRSHFKNAHFRPGEKPNLQFKPDIEREGIRLVSEIIQGVVPLGFRHHRYTHRQGVNCTGIHEFMLSNPWGLPFSPYILAQILKIIGKN